MRRPADWPIPRSPGARRPRGAAALVIDAEATRLDRLVGGVLDLSRIASGAIHPDLEPHELWAVVEPVVDRMRPSLGARPITISIPDSLPAVLADAVLLDLVVTNLLDNVVAHTPDDAAITISAASAPTSGDEATVTLTIEDGGPGVSTEQLSSLFERFKRATSRPEGSRRGLGIGLSVVRGLVECDGRPGRGGARVDRRSGGHRHAPPGSCGSRSMTPMARILLVEDDEATSDAVARNLEGHGFRVATSGDRGGGTPALGCRTTRPDPAGPRSARPRRSHRRPARSSGCHDADPDPVGADRRAGQGRDARSRRR